MTYWMNEWMSDKAVYRTAPATPGPLNIYNTYMVTGQGPNQNPVRPPYPGPGG